MEKIISNLWDRLIKITIKCLNYSKQDIIPNLDKY